MPLSTPSSSKGIRQLAIFITILLVSTLPIYGNGQEVRENLSASGSSMSGLSATANVGTGIQKIWRGIDANVRANYPNVQIKSLLQNAQLKNVLPTRQGLNMLYLLEDGRQCKLYIKMSSKGQIQLLKQQQIDFRQQLPIAPTPTILQFLSQKFSFSFPSSTPISHRSLPHKIEYTATFPPVPEFPSLWYTIVCESNQKSELSLKRNSFVALPVYDIQNLRPVTDQEMITPYYLGFVEKFIVMFQKEFNQGDGQILNVVWNPPYIGVILEKSVRNHRERVTIRLLYDNVQQRLDVLGRESTIIQNQHKKLIQSNGKAKVLGQSQEIQTQSSIDVQNINIEDEYTNEVFLNSGNELLQQKGKIIDIDIDLNGNADINNGQNLVRQTTQISHSSQIQHSQNKADTNEAVEHSSASHFQSATEQVAQSKNIVQNQLKQISQVSLQAHGNSNQAETHNQNKQIANEAEQKIQLPMPQSTHLQSQTEPVYPPPQPEQQPAIPASATTSTSITTQTPTSIQIQTHTQSHSSAKQSPDPTISQEVIDSHTHTQTFSQVEVEVNAGQVKQSAFSSQPSPSSIQQIQPISVSEGKQKLVINQETGLLIDHNQNAQLGSNIVRVQNQLVKSDAENVGKLELISNTVNHNTQINNNNQNANLHAQQSSNNNSDNLIHSQKQVAINQNNYKHVEASSSSSSSSSSSQSWSSQSHQQNKHPQKITTEQQKQIQNPQIQPQPLPLPLPQSQQHKIDQILQASHQIIVKNEESQPVIEISPEIAPIISNHQSIQQVSNTQQQQQNQQHVQRQVQSSQAATPLVLPVPEPEPVPVPVPVLAEATNVESNNMQINVQSGQNQHIHQNVQSIVKQNVVIQPVSLPIEHNGQTNNNQLQDQQKQKQKQNQAQSHLQPIPIIEQKPVHQTIVTHSIQQNIPENKQLVEKVSENVDHTHQVKQKQNVFEVLPMPQAALSTQEKVTKQVQVLVQQNKVEYIQKEQDVHKNKKDQLTVTTIPQNKQSELLTHTQQPQQPESQSQPETPSQTKIQTDSTVQTPVPSPSPVSMEIPIEHSKPQKQPATQSFEFEQPKQIQIQIQTTKQGEENIQVDTPVIDSVKIVDNFVVEEAKDHGLEGDGQLHVFDQNGVKQIVNQNKVENVQPANQKIKQVITEAKQTVSQIKAEEKENKQPSQTIQIKQDKQFEITQQSHTAVENKPQNKQSQVINEHSGQASISLKQSIRVPNAQQKIEPVVQVAHVQKQVLIPQAKQVTISQSQVKTQPEIAAVTVQTKHQINVQQKQLQLKQAQPQINTQTPQQQQKPEQQKHTIQMQTQQNDNSFTITIPNAETPFPQPQSQQQPQPKLQSQSQSPQTPSHKQPQHTIIIQETTQQQTAKQKQEQKVDVLPKPEAAHVQIQAVHAEKQVNMGTNLEHAVQHQSVDKPVIQNAVIQKQQLIESNQQEIETNTASTSSQSVNVQSHANNVQKKEQPNTVQFVIQSEKSQKTIDNENHQNIEQTTPQIIIPLPQKTQQPLLESEHIIQQNKFVPVIDQTFQQRTEVKNDGIQPVKQEQTSNGDQKQNKQTQPQPLPQPEPEQQFPLIEQPKTVHPHVQQTVVVTPQSQTKHEQAQVKVQEQVKVQNSVSDEILIKQQTEKPVLPLTIHVPELHSNQNNVKSTIEVVNVENSRQTSQQKKQQHNSINNIKSDNSLEDTISKQQHHQILQQQQKKVQIQISEPTTTTMTSQQPQQTSTIQIIQQNNNQIQIPVASISTITSASTSASHNHENEHDNAHQLNQIEHKLQDNRQKLVEQVQIQPIKLLPAQLPLPQVTSQVSVQASPVISSTVQLHDSANENTNLVSAQFVIDQHTESAHNKQTEPMQVTITVPQQPTVTSQIHQIQPVTHIQIHQPTQQPTQIKPQIEDIIVSHLSQPTVTVTVPVSQQSQTHHQKQQGHEHQQDQQSVGQVSQVTVHVSDPVTSSVHVQEEKQHGGNGVVSTATISGNLQERQSLPVLSTVTIHQQQHQPAVTSSVIISSQPEQQYANNGQQDNGLDAQDSKQQSYGSHPLGGIINTIIKATNSLLPGILPQQKSSSSSSSSWQSRSNLRSSSSQPIPDFSSYTEISPPDQYCMQISPSNPSLCQSCYNRFYLNRPTNRCIPIQQQCESYNKYSPQCYKCYTGYILREGKCIPSDPFCLKFDVESSNGGYYCMRCIYGFELVDGRCRNQYMGDRGDDGQYRYNGYRVSVSNGGSIRGRNGGYYWRY